MAGTAVRRGQGDEGGWDALVGFLEREELLDEASAYARGERCVTVRHAEGRWSAHEVGELAELADIVLASGAGGRGERLRITRRGPEVCWWWPDHEVARRHALLLLECSRGRWLVTADAE